MDRGRQVPGNRRQLRGMDILSMQTRAGSSCYVNADTGWKSELSALRVVGCQTSEILSLAGGGGDLVLLAVGFELQDDGGGQRLG